MNLWSSIHVFQVLGSPSQHRIRAHLRLELQERRKNKATHHQRNLLSSPSLQNMGRELPSWKTRNTNKEWKIFDK
jgi:hypothetical protein